MNPNPAITVTTADPSLQQVAVPQIAIAVAVVVLAALLGAVVIVTVGYSLRAAGRRRRRGPIRAALRTELLDRLYGRDEPAWDEWADSLSTAEREELEPLLDVYLRQLEGGDAARLAGLGVALGIDERARRDIADGDYWDRIHALVWLALLRDAPDRSLLEAHCRETPRERAAAARVLYAAETPDLATTGIDLLLGAEPRSFSVFGIDTLYRVSRADPGPLFERAAADFHAWEPALQQQVLLVARHLNTVMGDADLSWVVGALSSPEPGVRGAAWRALEAYGWNRSIRDRVALDLPDGEPVPAVRANAYRALGAWGDTEAVGALRTAAETEPHDRTRVALAGALYPHRSASDPLCSGPAERADDAAVDAAVDAADDATVDADDTRESTVANTTGDSRLGAAAADPFDAACRWTSEHARFDRLARDISRDGRTGGTRR